MNDTHAILIMAYGGPDSLDDVEPYLMDIRRGKPTPPDIVEKTRERYAAIGGKSPILEITQRQAKALEEELNRPGIDSYRVFVGMRHWKPYIEEAVGQIVNLGIERVTAICMTPFSSRMSTGAYHEQLTQAIATYSDDSPWRQNHQLTKIDGWYNHPGFIRAAAENLHDSLADSAKAMEDTPFVVFSAHSLPKILSEQGDPYSDQYIQLCNLVAAEAGLQTGGWLACYQCVGTPSDRWLGPSLETVIERKADDGCKSILVAPIGFLCDHVEILYDIDIEAKEMAESVGIRLTRTASLNDRPSFIHALTQIARDEIVHP